MAKSKNVRVPFIYTDKMMNTSFMEVADFSARTQNALLGAKICTIGDIIENYSNLQNVRNLGAGSLKEVHTFLISYQYQLYGDKFVDALARVNGVV